MQPLSSYTFADPKVMQNPYPYYERLRAEDPVHFDEGIKTWLVTRHDDILTVSRDTEVYSDEMRVSKAIRSPFQDEVEEYMKSEGFMVLDPADSFKVDGELHARRRKLVAHAFTGPTVAAMEARVAAICRDKAAAFLGRSHADLVKEYAMPIPILVICDALGLPMDHVDEISRGRTPWWRRWARAHRARSPINARRASCRCIASSGRPSRSGGASPVPTSFHKSFMHASTTPLVRSSRSAS